MCTQRASSPTPAPPPTPRRAEAASRPAEGEPDPFLITRCATALGKGTRHVLVGGPHSRAPAGCCIPLAIQHQASGSRLQAVPQRARTGYTVAGRQLSGSAGRRLATECQGQVLSVVLAACPGDVEEVAARLDALRVAAAALVGVPAYRQCPVANGPPAGAEVPVAASRHGWRPETCEKNQRDPEPERAQQKKFLP